MPIETINPATEKVIKVYPEMSGKEVTHIIDATYDAFQSWRELTYTQRAAPRHIASLLQTKKWLYKINGRGGKPLNKVSWRLKMRAVCDHYTQTQKNI